MTIVAPEIAERARPGQFVDVALPTGGAALLRRPFSIYKASRQGGWAGTIEFAFGINGPGTEWLSGVRAHQFLDVMGPLGKGFASPKNRTNCLLVGEGYAVGQLYFLAEDLRDKGKRVDMIVSGRTQDSIFKPIEGKRLASSVTVVTGDGSQGAKGVVGDVLAGVVGRAGSNVIYAAGTAAMLRVVADYCRRQNIPSQVAIEEAMGCGWGQCFTCVVPVARKDGSGTDYLRSCTDGPVFNSSRIAWDLFAPGPVDISEAPEDTGDVP